MTKWNLGAGKKPGTVPGVGIWDGPGDSLNMGYELYGIHMYTHGVQKERGCPFCYPWPIIGPEPWPALQAINLTHPRLPARLPPDGTGGPDPA